MKTINSALKRFMYEYQVDYIMEIGQAATEISIMEIARIYNVPRRFFTTCKCARSMQRHIMRSLQQLAMRICHLSGSVN